MLLSFLLERELKMRICEKILDIIFPRICGMCGKICEQELCNHCNRTIKELKRNKKHIYLTKNFDTHMYIFDYRDLIRQKILEYKFKEQNYLYRTFVKIVLNDKKICGFLKNYDIIIPVPIGKKRKKNRGYNQSELIARKISTNLKEIDYTNKVLYKVKDTVSQSKLDREKRKENLIGSYEIRNKHQIQNKKILLFDDIYTTGSTADECSKMLIEAGAKEVGVFTIAKD